MKTTSTIRPDVEASDRAVFEPRLADEARLQGDPRLYPQRKRAWDKLMADIESASATLRINKASVTKAARPSE